MPGEPEEGDLEELYAKKRRKRWPSQRVQMWTALLGDFEQLVVDPQHVREQKAEDLLRRLQAEGFFELLEKDSAARTRLPRNGARGACKFKFTPQWRKDVCLLVVSLEHMAGWDVGGRVKSLRAVLRRADKYHRMASEIEDNVEFRALTQNPYLPDEFRDVVRLPTLLQQWARLLNETIGTDVGNTQKLCEQIALQCLGDAFENAGGKVGGSWGNAGHLEGPFIRYLKRMWEILPPKIRGDTPEALAGRVKRPRPRL